MPPRRRRRRSPAAAPGPTASGGRGPRWGSARRTEALGADQLGDKVAKDDTLGVGDEVDLAIGSPLARQQQPVDDVVDVGGSGRVAPAADPGEAPGADHGGDLRQQGAITGPPHEAGPDDDPLEAVAAVG